MSQGKFIEADDALETALAVDPKNRAAFIAMARVAIKQKLYGQAIRLTNKALTLEPTDRDALAVQGEAMVELGALPRAKDNLAKLQKLCGKPAARRSRRCRRRSLAARPWRRPRPPKSQEELTLPPQESARASATNSSTLTRFGAALGVDPKRGQRIERSRHGFQAGPQHLAALAERGGGQPFQHLRASTPAGSAAGTMWTTAEATLGGGTKAERCTSMAMRGVERHCAATDRRP